MLNNPSEMNVSVIIPAYNNQQTVYAVLDALLSQKYECGKVEIIVVDDCSKDDTGKIIETFPVTYVSNQKNLGLAKSLNRAILLSKHDVVVTLHGDTLPVNSSWLQQLVSPLKDPNISATCSIQFTPRLDQRPATIWEKMLYMTQNKHLALNDKADAYKKTVLKEIGLFDEETFRTAGEDEDLALRLTLARKTILGTKAEVIHNHYFVNNGIGILKKILKREYSFGMAGGALRRKYPLYKPKSYILPQSASFTSDGLIRVALCIGASIPYVQMLFIPLLLIAASNGITKLKKEKKLLILYPFFNICRFTMYAFGYIVGLIKGKQK